MSIEYNKRIARQLVEGFSTDGDINTTFSLLRDDATWKVMADPQLFGVASQMSKVQFIEHMKVFYKSLSELRITITGITAEGDRVAVEAESNGVLKNGTKLNQVYHFLFEVDNGEVVLAREYIDTAHALAAFRG